MSYELFAMYYSHLRWTDQCCCFISSNFSDMVTIGWLVKFRERIFESFWHINMRYVKTKLKCVLSNYELTSTLVLLSVIVIHDCPDFQQSASTDKHMSLDMVEY